MADKKTIEKWGADPDEHAKDWQDERDRDIERARRKQREAEEQDAYELTISQPRPGTR